MSPDDPKKGGGAFITTRQKETTKHKKKGTTNIMGFLAKAQKPVADKLIEYADEFESLADEASMSHDFGASKVYNEVADVARELGESRQHTEDTMTIKRKIKVEGQYYELNMTRGEVSEAYGTAIYEVWYNPLAGGTPTPLGKVTVNARSGQEARNRKLESHVRPAIAMTLVDGTLPALKPIDAMYSNRIPSLDMITTDFRLFRLRDMRLASN